MILSKDGFCIFPSRISPEILTNLRESLFQDTTAGERCLLDNPTVREVAITLKRELISNGSLPPNSVAIQAIAFDKTPTTNWKVAWHQDLMFPFTGKVTAPHFDLPTIKQEVHYARPPVTILNQLLAARLHLDDCDSTNGPLRISPATHLAGIIPTADIPNLIAAHKEITCLAKTGEVLLMHPLCLHASSQATAPKHRRVLHFIYHSGDSVKEPWHRAI